MRSTKKKNNRQNNKVDNRRTTEEQQKNINKNVKKKENEKNENKYITAQHLSMTKEEYEKLVEAYSEKAVIEKVEYAENYTKLKNYKSLYLTLNNWLKADQEKKPPKCSVPYGWTVI